MKNSFKTNNVFKGAVLTLAAALIFIAYHASAANKVTICHIPNGNVENRHTLELPQGAANAHLLHGDHMGICNFGPPEVPEEHLNGPIL